MQHDHSAWLFVGCFDLFVGGVWRLIDLHSTARGQRSACCLYPDRCIVLQLNSRRDWMLYGTRAARR